VDAIIKKFPYSGATFSQCGQFRYRVWRRWTPFGSMVLFIGLNPSTANESRDDPTLRRCREFSQSWGYSGFTIVNLFAYRATDPTILSKVEDPVGPRNDAWIEKCAKASDIIIAAWGNHGLYAGRGKTVRKFIPEMYCLRMNRTGEPAHPLYLPKTLRPRLLQNTLKSTD
jgi:hypothetical protein